jgi:hypothetical protein
MKKVILFLLGYCLGGQLLHAGLPMPCVNYYGMLTDEYGAPFLEHAEIFLMNGTNECDRYGINGLAAAGVNVELQLEIDSGGTPYAPYAVHVGDPVLVVVKVGGVEQEISPTDMLFAAGPGESVRLDLFTGTDSDGDGLPDEWEELLMSQSGGTVTNIQQITKDGDFDGDGASNWQEFLAGTFPFLANDVFAIDGMEMLGDRIRFEFLSLNGKVYRMQTTSALESNEWVSAAFALDEVSGLTETALLGDGSFKTIFIGISEDTKFVRIGAD